MSRKLTRPRVLLWISGILGAIFLIVGLVLAVYRPIVGIPLYGKFILGAIFLAGVVYSFHLEAKGDKVVPQNNQKNRPQKPTEQS